MTNLAIRGTIAPHQIDVMLGMLKSWNLDAELLDLPVNPDIKGKKQAMETGIFPPKRTGSLTEGYGFWANDAQFNETNYRDKLWQAKRNVW
jgi:hypothetical protein